MPIRTAIAAVVLAGIAGTASGEGIIWDVIPDFAGKKARLEISGAVCAGDDGAGDWCVAVNDETRFVQFFSAASRRIVPGDKMFVLEDKAPSGADFDEPDLEAVAYHRGFVYLVGSHGKPRKTAGVEPARYFVFRFPVDRASGKPDFSPGGDDVPAAVERSGRLKALIEDADGLKGFTDLSPDDNGVNIEGAAVRGDSIFFGFRAPVHADGAVILQVALGRLFGGADDPPVSHRVDLGAGYGIRDMAPWDDGFLLLAGAAGKQALAPAVWFWRPGSAARLLQGLAVDPRRKAEGLLVVDSGKDTIRLLVFFDSEKNGAPAEFAVPKP